VVCKRELHCLVGLAPPRKLEESCSELTELRVRWLQLQQHLPPVLGRGCLQLHADVVCGGDSAELLTHPVTENGAHETCGSKLVDHLQAPKQD
jgi:hypothetical protein